MLKELFEELLGKLFQITTEYYHQRLVTLAIFGSVGRGTQRQDSDIDLLIIAAGLPPGRMRRIQEFEEIERKLETYLEKIGRAGVATCLSPIIKSREEARLGSPLFLDMIEDVRILYDKDRFFAGILENLKARLDTLGSQRIKLGNAWYWVLKPDLQPGEVFEL